MQVSIGCARIPRQEGSQNLDLQVDALLKAGVPSERIYSDLYSGRKDARSGLENCLKALQHGNILVA